MKKPKRNGTRKPKLLPPLEIKAQSLQRAGFGWGFCTTAARKPHEIRDDRERNARRAAVARDRYARTKTAKVGR